MRHLSHAFHTLLCLPSNTTELCSCDEPDLFELLLRDLEGFDIFLDRCDLLSSNGGEGKPELDMSLKGIEKSVVGWGGWSIWMFKWTSKLDIGQSDLIMWLCWFRGLSKGGWFSSWLYPRSLLQDGWERCVKCWLYRTLKIKSYLQDRKSIRERTQFQNSFGGWWLHVK